MRAEYEEQLAEMKEAHKNELKLCAHEGVERQEEMEREIAAMATALLGSMIRRIARLLDCLFADGRRSWRRRAGGGVRAEAGEGGRGEQEGGQGEGGGHQSDE
eukprot:3102817-Prymnesium_polylepis.1